MSAALEALLGRKEQFNNELARIEDRVNCDLDVTEHKHRLSVIVLSLA